MARQVVYTCDFCGNRTNSENSFSFEDFVKFVYGEKIILDKSKIRENVDLCDTCKNKITSVRKFVDYMIECK